MECDTCFSPEEMYFEGFEGAEPNPKSKAVVEGVVAIGFTIMAAYYAREAYRRWKGAGDSH